VLEIVNPANGEKIQIAEPKFTTANISKMSADLTLNGRSYNVNANCKIKKDSSVDLFDFYSLFFQPKRDVFRYIFGQAFAAMPFRTSNSHIFNRLHHIRWFQLSTSMVAA
jgi:hypothetical protein